MNNHMAYLMGMIIGNGEVRRGSSFTTVSISIPHKNQKTFNNNDVKIYVKASITDIRDNLEQLVGAILNTTQNSNYTIIYFEKPNGDYLIREINRLTNNAVSHEMFRVHNYFFTAPYDEKISFLRGFSDVTGYIRESNYAYSKPYHRVYLEIPKNWYLVIDICNLLKSVDIPVQTVDWAHPNIRDGNLIKYNQGNLYFWKKEHQIKIFANEFLPVGFSVIHKQEALDFFSKQLIEHIESKCKDVTTVTHKYYWDTPDRYKYKPTHPCENDPFIPEEIRGKHYNSWKEIAKDLGYYK